VKAVAVAVVVLVIGVMSTLTIAALATLDSRSRWDELAIYLGGAVLTLVLATCAHRQIRRSAGRP